VEPKGFPDRLSQLSASAQTDDGEAVEQTRGAEVERRILEAVGSLEYGSVEIVVHDSQVVQIERREKLRFDKPARPDAGDPRRTVRSRRPSQSAPGAQ
jgi:hypothetical protein